MTDITLRCRGRLCGLRDRNFGVGSLAALLFDLRFDEPHRPTRDADFPGFGPADLPTTAATFREIAAMKVDDGIIFDPSTVKAQETRKEADYACIRITLLGTLDGGRCPIQADIGFQASRLSALPATTPIGLSDEFSADEEPPRRTAIASGCCPPPQVLRIISRESRMMVRNAGVASCAAIA